MTEKPDRDIEKDYPLPDFVEKLRRLADALEQGRRFEIQIAGERISVPARATYNIEHERGEDGEESSSRSSGLSRRTEGALPRTSVPFDPRTPACPGYGMRPN